MTVETALKEGLQATINELADVREERSYYKGKSEAYETALEVITKILCKEEPQEVEYEGEFVDEDFEED